MIIIVGYWRLTVGYYRNFYVIRKVESENTSSIVLIKIVEESSLGGWYLYHWVSHRKDRQMHLSSRVQWRYRNFEIEAGSIILLCCVVMLDLVPYIGHLTEGRTQYVPWRPALLFMSPHYKLLQLNTTPFNNNNNNSLCCFVIETVCVCVYAYRTQGRLHHHAVKITVNLTQILPRTSLCVIELKDKPLDCSQTQLRYFICKKTHVSAQETIITKIP